MLQVLLWEARIRRCSVGEALVAEEEGDVQEHHGRRVALLLRAPRVGGGEEMVVE